MRTAHQSYYWRILLRSSRGEIETKFHSLMCFFWLYNCFGVPIIVVYAIIVVSAQTYPIVCKKMSMTEDAYNLWMMC